VLVPRGDIPEDQAEIEVEIVDHNVIVMSQSCDLVEGQKDVPNVVVCPIYSFQQLEKEHPDLAKKGQMDRMRKELIPSYHLLNECALPEMSRSFLIVNFRQVFTMPIDFVRRQVSNGGQRLRLRSPYRERLSQAFGRYLMRVALPPEADIKPFK
jgi:hypothetical protein